MNMFSQMTGQSSERKLGEWREVTAEDLKTLAHTRMIKQDVVNYPSHYTSHPSGIECIQITEHMNFLLGNAIKYIWRSDLKNGVEDLQKAIFYINREIQNRTKKG